jgi:nuclear RNA export factor
MLSVLDQEALPRLAFDVEASTVNAAQVQASTTMPVLPELPSFPAPMQPNLFVGGVETISAQFLTQYFTLFDTNRSALDAVYAPHATFSLSANTSIPPRARKRGFLHSAEMPNQRSLNWEFYRGASRNLERINAGSSSTNPDKAVELLHTGPHAILAALVCCPATKHDMSKPEKFVVDAFPMVGLLRGEGCGTDALFIQVHGEFAEGIYYVTLTAVVSESILTYRSVMGDPLIRSFICSCHCF